MNRWSEYVKRQMRTSQKELAERTGLQESAISRWVGGNSAKAEQVIAFARALNKNPIEALVMAGYLKPREANMIAENFSLSDLDDVVLLTELRERAILRAQGK